MSASAGGLYPRYRYLAVYAGGNFLHPVEPPVHGRRAWWTDARTCRLIRQRKPHKWLYYKCLTFPPCAALSPCIAPATPRLKAVRNVLGEDARILLVPNGIDSRDIHVTQYPAGEGMKLCFLGHVQQEKGINAFIRAWLKVRNPSDRLVIAGRSVDGAYFESFRRWSNRRKALSATGAIWSVPKS